MEPRNRIAIVSLTLSAAAFVGIVQRETAAIVRGELILPIAGTAQQVSADITAPATLPFTHGTALEQLLRTGAMSINPYQSFALLPAEVTLFPAVDRWTDVVDAWSSPVTERFTFGTPVAVIGGSTNASSSSTSTAVRNQLLATTKVAAETLRTIDVAYSIGGCGVGETLAEAIFDGVSVLPAGPVPVANAQGVISGAVRGGRMDLREPGNPIDERTPALSLPLVHILNAAEDDVGRMRAALQLLDDLVADRVTQAQLVAAVAALVGSSPAALDTLQELADALGRDANFATTMTNKLAALQAAIAAITFANLQGKPTTLAGYGITDAVSAVTTSAVLTANFTAQVGMLHLVDTSAGVLTGTMPVNPNPGNECYFLDYGKSFDVNSLTLDRNTRNFAKLSDNYVINKKNTYRTARYINSVYGWSVR